MINNHQKTCINKAILKETLYFLVPGGFLFNKKWFLHIRCLTNKSFQTHLYTNPSQLNTLLTSHK